MFNNKEENKNLSKQSDISPPAQNNLAPQPMADDQIKAKSNQVEDIYSGVDLGPAPGPLPEDVSQTQNTLPDTEKPIGFGKNGKKILFLVLLLVLALVLGVGAYFAFSFLSPENNNEQPLIIEEEADQNLENKELLPEEEEPSDDTSKTSIDNILPPDFDGDGLDDITEREYGTNPNNPDTDGDVINDWEEISTYFTNPLVVDSDSDDLSDYEEINYYQTDPNNPDTDSDGYSDGEEVANGYNPLGSGLLE